MRLTFLGLLFLTLPLFAAEPLDFTNDREGTSVFSSRSDTKLINKSLKQVEASQIIDAFNEIKSEFSSLNICSFDINASMSEKLKKINPKFDELDGVILYLRSQNEFDDSFVKILRLANKTENTHIYPPRNPQHIRPLNSEAVAYVQNLLEGFEEKLITTCFDEAYRNLIRDILKYNKNLKGPHLQILFQMSYKNKIITRATYLRLEKARVNELETLPLSIREYLNKIQSLRNQYPLRDPGERSDFVTMKADKLKISRRQKLLEEYSDLQIILMANVIKKLRKRIEAPKAEILIYDRQNVVETIPLEAMERFRLAIKLIRKEMNLLSLNTYFAGRTPDYIDLMTAAYETGTIPASELHEVAGLQDIWNPKKTFWEKSKVWVRTLGSVATIAIPPPFGFIPALALVVIEMTTQKNAINTNDPTVLF